MRHGVTTTHTITPAQDRIVPIERFEENSEVENDICRKNNTNEEVFRQANEHIQNETRQGKIPKKLNVIKSVMIL